uniref:Glycosyl transferase CAP10 domain-containing protein n=1 Tax=Aureoumbra lagunensis TaxID=44058 RepID=A0A6S8BPF8_9STRA
MTLLLLLRINMFLYMLRKKCLAQLMRYDAEDDLALEVLSSNESFLRCPPLQESIRIDEDEVELVIKSENVKLPGLQLCAHKDLPDEVCAVLLRYLEKKWQEHCSNLKQKDVSLEEEMNYKKKRIWFQSWSESIIKNETKQSNNNRIFEPPLNENEIKIWTPPPNFIANIAQAVTAPWVQRKISRSQVEAAAEKDDDCVLFQLIHGEVYAIVNYKKLETWQNSPFPWRARRRLAVFELLQRLAPKLQRDLEVVFCPHDCVLTTNRANQPEKKNFYAHHGASNENVLILSLVGCAHSDSIPFPVFDVRTIDLNESLQNWDNVVSQHIIRNRETSFPKWYHQQRDHRAIFRGQVQGKSCWSGDSYNQGIGPQSSILDQYGLPSCGRRRLFSLGAKWPRRFDIDFDRIPLLAQEVYRYQIYAEGHCGWSDRLKFLLFMGSAIFFQETFCREFYAYGLEPWVHYLPIAYHFDNLAKIHEWAQSHPSAVLRIIHNMHTYAYTILNQAAIHSYAITVLNQIGSALNYIPVVRSHATTQLPSNFFAQ